MITVALDTHMLGRKRTGIERYWSNIHRELAAQSNLIVRRYPSYTSPFRKNAFYRTAIGLNLLVKQSSADILHTDMLGPLIKICPLVITVHDICFIQNPKFYPISIRMFYKKLFLYSINQADGIICNSKATKSQLLLLLKKPAPIFVTPLGIDPVFKQIKNNTKNLQALKTRFNINKKFFLVVGNIEMRKNPSIIISAFNKFNKSYSNFQLIIAGQPTYQGRQIIQQNSRINKNIRFINFIPDNELNILYNRATALICYSHCEGFGLPIVEAMSCGCPVICNDIAPFIETGSSSASYFKSEEELLDHMKKIILNKYHSRKAIEKGIQHSSAFSWKKTAEKTIQVYKKVLEQSKNKYP